jgi:hypothetical protein
VPPSNADLAYHYQTGVDAQTHGQAGPVLVIEARV